VGFKCGITAALLIDKNSSRAPPKKYLEKQTLNKKCLEFNPAWRFVMAFFWKIESFIFRFQLLWNSICMTNPIAPLPIAPLPFFPLQIAPILIILLIHLLQRDLCNKKNI
jgi:hypothetical protein